MTQAVGEMVCECCGGYPHGVSLWRLRIVGTAVGTADLVGTQFLQIAGQRRLGDANLLRGQLLQQVALGTHRPTGDDAPDQGVARGLGSGDHAAPRRNSRTAFCTCRRFSASCHTTEAGPSSTSSVISLPR